jgi:hypothetical protein
VPAAGSSSASASASATAATAAAGGTATTAATTGAAATTAATTGAAATAATTTAGDRHRCGRHCLTKHMSSLRAFLVRIWSKPAEPTRFLHDPSVARDRQKR